MEFNVNLEIFDVFKPEFKMITINIIKEVLKWRMKNDLLDIKDYNKEERYLINKIVKRNNDNEIQCSFL